MEEEQFFSEEEKVKIDKRINRWYSFMATKKFIVLMNVVRILTLIGVGILIWYLVKEIEAVKMLAYDPCAICMNKTGCMCACTNFNEFIP